MAKGKNSIQEVPCEVVSDWAAILTGSMLAQTVCISLTFLPRTVCPQTPPPSTAGSHHSLRLSGRQNVTFLLCLPSNPKTRAVLWMDVVVTDSHGHVPPIATTQEVGVSSQQPQNLSAFPAQGFQPRCLHELHGTGNLSPRCKGVEGTT